MKHEWRKHEKDIYNPKAKPEFRPIPEYAFFTIEGEGNPNSALFSSHIQALYTLAYGVRMSHKQAYCPKGYFEYTVYPLEGVWDLKEAAIQELKKDPNATFTKDDLKYKIMIRQPAFVDEAFAEFIKSEMMRKKKTPYLDLVQFERIEEGPCIQMLHKGSYDDEIKSFELMEAFSKEMGYRRKSKIHREIYLTNPGKVAPEKLKTILRFQVDLG